MVPSATAEVSYCSTASPASPASRSCHAVKRTYSKSIPCLAPGRPNHALSNKLHPHSCRASQSLSLGAHSLAPFGRGPCAQPPLAAAGEMACRISLAMLRHRVTVIINGPEQGGHGGHVIPRPDQADSRSCTCHRSDTAAFEYRRGKSATLYATGCLGRPSAGPPAADLTASSGATNTSREASCRHHMCSGQMLA